MHSRSPSGSYRIPVASSPSSSAASSSIRSGSPSRDYLSRPRRRVSGAHRTPTSALRNAYHDATSWLTGRVGRTGLRRWMLLVGLSLGAALFLSSRTTATDDDRGWRLWPSRDEDALDTGPAVPVVDRSALEKLRLLEIHFGADEDDPAVDPVDEHRDVRYTARKGPHDLDRPPLVVDIPEFVKPNPLAPVPPERVPADVLDYEVCGAGEGQVCQFLIPAWLGEQETKAQQHLYQLGLLALALNRTLVLPNVSKSRLGTCYKNPFGFYYAESSLSDLGIRTIKQDDFVAWTLQRDPPPSAQVITMANAKVGYPQGAVEIDSASDPTLVPSKPNRNLCLRAPRTRLDFAGHSPLAMFPPEGYHKSEAGRLGFGESVINTLRSREVGSKSSRASASRHAAYALPDVLAFNYELRFPILSPAVAAAFSPSPDIPTPLPFAHFPYAETWTSLADVVVSRLSPFVAIHWRTETLTPANLAPCASSLLSKLAALKRLHPTLRNVYLATDYPIEALDPSLAPSADPAAAAVVAHSGTFAKSVTEQHHAAMRRFLREFKRAFGGRGAGALALTTFSKEQAALAEPGALPAALAAQLANLTAPLLPPALDGAEPAQVQAPLLALGTLDSGLYGILDKLVASRAELFVTGVPGVGSSTAGACAKLSSFTTQLVGAREVAMEVQRAGLEDGEEEGEQLEQGRLWNTVTHFALSGEEVD
ncbi:hypothetical protein JCM10450v2_002373 [Rhodotorula kratochvilovae]